ncbi:response regulator [Aestuariirhabdus sp. Z084]|uniref:response regulator n=1 Tax=Aestuariirhabdus haliotis TaxID=2918751 RepID=UPI00201B45BE|nr:response regulator [Aestuariirhabdus haliotis]MCL6414863.1 response regulator [Aestuariirhabdus haliotis]MCL6418795.1 response regulator [Aestuariirhabdus haliotis]
MSSTILICDDSAMARKQLGRALPSDLDATVSFAQHGEEALTALNKGEGNYLFLDLTMPVLDGYGVLNAIREQGIQSKVIVVSGDIQPKARERVQKLGALGFIKKPASAETLANIVDQLGIPRKKPATESAHSPPSPDTGDDTDKQTPDNLQNLAEQFVEKTDYIDAYREITNVAIGRAADLLARLLDVFVVMPVPRVNLIEVSELQMALTHSDKDDSCSAICQGFIGAGIAGEALLIFHDSSYQDIARKMGYSDEIDAHTEMEVLMDVANIMIGACLKGLENQLDLTFSQSHPKVLGQHLNVSQILTVNTKDRWQKTLAIELGFSVEGLNIECDLLLLITEQSVAFLNERIGYLVE